ncbi:MAG: hypothetical protein K0S67_581 [Nitrososphaeraceae archaeon]|nr:hypothetical protein [Nitrososphaeraceae archaeon]
MLNPTFIFCLEPRGKILPDKNKMAIGNESLSKQERYSLNEYFHIFLQSMKIHYDYSLNDSNLISFRDIIAIIKRKIILNLIVLW